MTVISLHIQKTAGTSFREALKRTYGSGLLLDYGDAGNDAIQPAGLGSEIKCIHGHFRPCKYLDLLPGATWITWLRDPAQRVMSQYYQYRNHPNPDDPGSRQYFMERKISFEEYLTIPGFQNQVGRLMEPLNPAEFTFIGLTERFDQSMERFSEILGVNLATPPFKHNVNPDKKSWQYQIDSSLAAQIRAANEEDYALYHAVIDWFWKS